MTLSEQYCQRDKLLRVTVKMERMLRLQTWTARQLIQTLKQARAAISAAEKGAK
jgi:exo-beta-1,3-glucanase (GH17 family)